MHIGHDVWIGANAIILGGIRLGQGAVVGAGAVVTKDVEPYAIVGGIPARVIRYRFSPETIRAIESTNWWEADETLLARNAHLFRHPDQFRASFLALQESALKNPTGNIRQR